MAWGITSIPFISMVALAAYVDPQCQTLIDAHVRSLELVRTVQLEYTLSALPTPELPDAWLPVKVLWTRDGKKERIGSASLFFESYDASGRPIGDGLPMFGDLVIKEDEFQYLQNWDPHNPPKLTPTRQGRVRAHVTPRSGTNPGTRSPAQNLYYSEIESHPRRTLSELAQVSPKVECKGKVQVDGRELWLISLESPEEVTATTSKKYYDVYLDPQVGHLIRKVVVRVKARSPETGVREYTHAHEVFEFKDFGDGVFVPTRVRNGSLDSWMSEVVVTSVKVNQPIPADTFEMKWPKYVRISYHSKDGSHPKTVVWGDGEPLAEFGPFDDIQPFEDELRRDPAIAAELGPAEFNDIPPPPASTLARLSIALGVLLAIMVGLVLWRRIREQAT